MPPQNNGFQITVQSLFNHCLITLETLFNHAAGGGMIKQCLNSFRIKQKNGFEHD